MIRLISLTISGKTEKKDFSGTINFSQGTNIINAENGFGKSLIFNGLVWTLGLEQYFASRANDTSIWTDAVLDKVELEDGQRHKILYSEAMLKFLSHDKKIITIRRPIQGGDIESVFCEVEDNGKNEDFKLYTSKTHTFDNPNISLMRNIFTWANLIPLEVYTYKGKSNLYLENLAPLFLIHQMSGWADLFTDQVRRYGIVNVDELSVEYMLGATSLYEERLAKIALDIHRSTYRTELVDVLKEVDAFVKIFNEQGISIGTKSIEKLVEEYGEFSIVDHISTNHNFSFEKEKKNLIDKIDLLNKKIDFEEKDNNKINTDQSLAAKREALFILKDNKRKITDDMEAIKFEIIDDQYVIKELESKSYLLKDLEILKKDNVGLLNHLYACPTCEQSVNPASFDIVNLNLEEVSTAHAIKKSELASIKKSFNSKKMKLAALEEMAIELSGKINNIENDFKFLDHTLSGSKKEYQILFTSLNDAKSDIAKLDKSLLRANEIDRLLKDKISHIANFLNTNKKNFVKEDTNLVTNFEKKFRELINTIKLTAFKSDKLQTRYKTIVVQRETDYIPTLEGKPLKRFCSASDQSKIIISYLIALQSVAKNHIGFTIFDEPIQQNPEGKYRETTIEFLSKLPANTEGQCIIFTKIELNEEVHFKNTNGFQSLLGKRFLTST